MTPHSRTNRSNPSYARRPSHSPRSKAHRIRHKNHMSSVTQLNNLVSNNRFQPRIIEAVCTILDANWSLHELWCLKIHPSPGFRARYTPKHTSILHDFDHFEESALRYRISLPDSSCSETKGTNPITLSLRSQPSRLGMSRAVSPLTAKLTHVSNPKSA